MGQKNSQKEKKDFLNKWFKVIQVSDESFKSIHQFVLFHNNIDRYATKRQPWMAARFLRFQLISEI